MHRVRWSAVLFALALVGAACGGRGDGDATGADVSGVAQASGSFPVTVTGATFE